MQHSIFGRKLNRTSNERKRLFRNLSRSLILHGQIRTTYAKAKSIQPYVEKLITQAKKDAEVSTKRLLLRDLPYNDVVKKLYEIAPLFKNRKGGYTRIIKLGSRMGDNANEVLLGFTETVVNTTLTTAIKTNKIAPVKNEKTVKVENAKNKTNKTK